ncbi:MAG: methyltransferase [Acetobacteraceae bacterium]|nr:methyltransferase [Acetobacteraceae bacterium]
MIASASAAAARIGRGTDARGWLDRLLASERFRHWAAGFPLTRPIARRRARALFDLCAGFVYSQVLYACVRLRLFDMLAEEPQSAAVLARRMGLPAEGADRLLAAAASLGLVARRGDRFGLGRLGAAMVGNPGLAAMVEHHAVLYADLQDPVALLRGEGKATGLSRYWPYAGASGPEALGAEQVGAYTALMAASQPLVAAEILESYPLGRHRCLLDVGGGDGSFVTAAAARAPHLRFMLFDLPAVAGRARARFATGGIADRAVALGGDFLSDDLPRGADVVSLVRIIHDHDDEAALAILRRAFAALPAGGTLLLAEPMAGTAGAEPVGDAYFGFYLLAMGSGRPRSLANLQALLTRAGFVLARPRRTRLPLLTRLIVATKPATPQTVNLS